MAAARIMSSLTPTTTKKPKRKKKPTPKYVGRLPPSKPYHMSDTQWEALQAMHLQFEDYRRELYTEKHNAYKAHMAHMVQSAVKIQRCWWMWRFRKGLPERRNHRWLTVEEERAASDAWLWSGEQ